VPDKLPPEVIEHWPEIFKDIEIKAVPVEYINSVVVRFDDGETWEIDLSPESLDVDEVDIVEVIEDTLEAFFEEYDEYIESVDFRLNTQKVIDDITKRVSTFLKKRK
jgi:hypothetical protein